MIQSFKTFDRWIVASACLLLAGKVEETPKKCKDILKVAKAQLADHQWVKFGADPKVSVFKVGFEGGGGGGGGCHMRGWQDHMSSAWLRRNYLPMKGSYCRLSSLICRSNTPMPTSSNLLKL